eukprot:2766872-Amphidinium_carterae.1
MSRSHSALARGAARESGPGSCVSPDSMLSPHSAEDNDDLILVADLQSHPAPTRNATAPRSGAQSGGTWC